MSQTDGGRAAAIARVLESVIVVSQALGAERRGLFPALALTSTQLRALYLLAHDPLPLTPSRLAARLDVTPGAVTQLIDGLRTAGLVETTPHPTDARSRILRLQDAAATEVAAFERAMVDRLGPMFADLSDSELLTLAGTFARVVVDA